LYSLSEPSEEEGPTIKKDEKKCRYVQGGEKFKGKKIARRKENVQGEKKFEGYVDTGGREEGYKEYSETSTCIQR
jgi:hypothetical protein